MNFFDYKIYKTYKDFNLQIKREFDYNDVIFYSIKNKLKDIYIKTPKFKLVNRVQNNKDVLNIDYNFFDKEIDDDLNSFYKFISLFETYVKNVLYDKLKLNNTSTNNKFISILNDEFNIKLSPECKIYDKNKNISSYKDINVGDICILAIHIKYIYISENIYGITYECDQIRYYSSSRPSILDDNDFDDIINISPPLSSIFIPPLPPPPPPLPAFLLLNNNKNGLVINKNKNNNGNNNENKNKNNKEKQQHKFIDELKSGNYKLKKIGDNISSTSKNKDEIDPKLLITTDIKSGNYTLRKVIKDTLQRKYESICRHSVDEIINIKNKLKNINKSTTL